MAKKNNIWHYVHNVENFSGAAFQGVRLAKEVNKQNLFRCTVINKSSRNIFKKVRDENIDIYHIPVNSCLRFLSLIYIFITNKIDLLHIHGYEDIVFFVSLVFRKKVFLKSTIVGEDFKSLSKKRTKVFLRLISKVAYNNALCSPVYKVNKEYTNNISIIPNFIETIEKIGMREKDNLFLIVGGICERKRTFEAINYYIEHFSTKVKGARLLVVGSNTANFGEYSAPYVTKCEQLSEKHEDIEICGQQSKKHIISIFKKAKAMLFFSSREGFANVLTESLSMSCVPIVLSDNETAYDIIEDKVNGLILKNTIDKIQQKDIEHIIDSGQLYETASNYLLENVVQEYNKLYLNILC